MADNKKQIVDWEQLATEVLAGILIEIITSGGEIVIREASRPTEEKEQDADDKEGA